MKQRKVFINPHTNLLQLQEPIYQLVDVDQPNTFRNLFPYDEVPKVAFNDRIVPHNRMNLLLIHLDINNPDSIQRTNVTILLLTSIGW